MLPALLVRLRPTTPWRIGSASGARDETGFIYHSDTLYSALCAAMASLGTLDTWLAATAQTPSPDARVSSMFPFRQETLLAPPPRSHWPPPPSTKIRWTAAQFAPMSLIAGLLRGEPLDEDNWVLDPPSACLLPVDRRSESTGPFRPVQRASASVDRLDASSVEASRIACLEFAPDSGLWCAVEFASDAAATEWSPKIESAFRLLADSGFGGQRSRGFGRSAMPEFGRGELPRLLIPTIGASEPEAAGEWWLLSQFSPAEGDLIDWSHGAYAIDERGGRMESVSGWGAEKKVARMVAEGSVLRAALPPHGCARNVAPDGAAHPAWRAGFGVSIAIPAKVTA
jgi:CRISPR/Cas system CSM-associated protein Csm4 (group 5 of RAMP superfamily)